MIHLNLTLFQIHLRPEFIEFTNFLYKATGDYYNLQVSKKVNKDKNMLDFMRT
jgi:hypothetical protein